MTIPYLHGRWVTTMEAQTLYGAEIVYVEMVEDGKKKLRSIFEG